MMKMPSNLNWNQLHLFISTPILNSVCINDRGIVLYPSILNSHPNTNINFKMIKTTFKYFSKNYKINKFQDGILQIHVSFIVDKHYDNYISVS